MSIGLAKPAFCVASRTASTLPFRPERVATFREALNKFKSRASRASTESDRKLCAELLAWRDADRESVFHTRSGYADQRPLL